MMFYAPKVVRKIEPRMEKMSTENAPLIIAIVVYILLHLAINGLLRMLAHRKTAI